MDAVELVRLYPRFGITEEGRIFPTVAVPRDFRELVPRFYDYFGNHRVLDFVDEFYKKHNGEMDIRLKWHGKLGLTNIDLGTHFGFDLNEKMCEFQEHNLDGKFSLMAAAIAQKYVWELLKYRK